MKEFKEARERYEATPIPEELDRRVRAGIRQGRSRYRARRLRRSLGAAAACFVVVFRQVRKGTSSLSSLSNAI